MQLHAPRRIFSISLIVVVGATAAAADTSSAPRTPRGTMRHASAAHPEPRGFALRRPRPATDPTCSSGGGAANAPGSFIGANNVNAVGNANQESAILGGTYNYACDATTGIGAGDHNSIPTSGNIAYSSFIGGGHANTIDAGATSATAINATIGGGEGNTVQPGAYQDASNAFIGGGGGNAVSQTAGAVVAGTSNAVSEPYAFVGAGQTNGAAGQASFIGAGVNNYTGASNAVATGGNANVSNAANAFVGGGDTNYVAGLDGTVAGGYHNTAASLASTVGGGYLNRVTAQGGTVAGGTGNQVRSSNASVPGGYRNIAGGDNSFAAGTYAYAATIGSFVWSDASSVTQFRSTAPNQFLDPSVGRRLRVFERYGDGGRSPRSRLRRVGFAERSHRQDRSRHAR